jgi:sulfur-carrier protein
VALTVAVRFFAGARAAAGVAEDKIELPDGATVATLVTLLVEDHGPGLARVLAASTFLLDEVAGGAERTLYDGAQVDVLPPFAGG